MNYKKNKNSFNVNQILQKVHPKRKELKVIISMF